MHSKLSKLKQFFIDTGRKLHRTQQHIVRSAAYQFLQDRLTQYALLCRLDKPIGIFLLLWPTLSALWVAAAGKPDAVVLFIFVAGTILMRSAGCAINDFADRNIDGHIKRTKNRPIASGKVKPYEALAVFALLCLLALWLVLQTNQLTIYLSVVAVFLAGLYPFAKRFTYLPQIVLGAAFAWSIPMAFAAQTGSVPVVAWLMYIAVVLWATAYDTMYAMVDREDDIKIGVRSTAILFGSGDVPIIMFLQCMVLLAFFLLGRQLELSYWYFSGLGIAAGLAAYQYFLIRHRKADDCFKAFLNNNYFGMAIFLGILAHYSLWTPPAS